MLQLLLGRGRKTLPRLLEQMGRDAEEGRQALLIVPEQYSHQMERMLCSVLGNESCLFAEVLSFTRLAGRVSAQAGGLAVSVLDNGGRILTMQRAQKLSESKLSLYAGASLKPAFLKELLSTIDELKNGAATPEMLYEAAGRAEGAQRQRLEELALLYGAYDSLLGQGCCDPKDRLTRLSDQLETCPYGADKALYFYGFTDFTAQEQKVVKALFGQGARMTVALPCDSLEEKEDRFVFARQTGRFLQRMANRKGRDATVTLCETEQGDRAPALLFLEHTLFAEGTAPAPETLCQNGVCCMEAYTPFSEVEWAAEQILRLVEETGCRFRDIAVVARGFESYTGLVDVVFERYGIPVFLSQMTDILQKPILSLVVSALEVIQNGYEYEDVFRYLKTGLTHLSLSECDLMENYVLCWDIRGKRGYGKPWTGHPDGFGKEWTAEDEERLATLNELRERFAAPFRRLEQSGATTAKGQARALYAFLEEIQLPQRLERQSEALDRAGRREQGEEYRQLWKILCTGLEQCVDLLEDTEMTLEAFSGLFSLVLSQYDVGTIPVSLDRVTAGEAMRVGQQSVSYLFLLGATDEALPMAPDPPGVLKEEDRVFLEEVGLSLSPTEEYRLLREMATIDAVCAMPTEGLFLSYPKGDMGGGQCRPSFLIERVRRLLPKAVFQTEGEAKGARRIKAPRPALETAALHPRENETWLDQLGQLPEYQKAVEAVKRAAALGEGRLSPPMVRSLYGDKVSMSASRLDKHRSCHFAYFMQYGMRARERRAARFEAPEMGTLVHFVLERVLAERPGRGEASEEEQETLRAACRREMETYAETVLGGLADKTPRFRYLFRRLETMVFFIVKNVIEELEASDFTPISFELGFGEKGELPPLTMEVDGITLSVSGFVDRVDGWEKDGVLYLRVVDYKTGAKSFDLTEIWNGLGMQMLLYLFALEKEGERLYQKPVCPAGVLYLPARQVILSGVHGMTEEMRQSKVDAALRRKGLLLGSPQVLEAMEHCKETGARFLPVHVSRKTGAFSGDALVTAAEFSALSRHLDKVLREMAEELRDGAVAPNPWYRGPMKQACLFCPYASACQFDPACGGKRRYFKTQKPADFWGQVLNTPARPAE
ncbi:MAG: PD-(D/E)XK nuclease family protein [Oscillospiraceae bacterium]